MAFLALPSEIRLKVYRYLLLTRLNKIASPVDNSAHHDLQSAILRTCKLIEKEARAVLYRENTFIHIIHDIPSIEMKSRKNQLSLLGKHHPQQFPQLCNLKVSMVVQSDTAFRNHHIMIPSEDLELMCSSFCINLLRDPNQVYRHLYVYLDFSEPANEMTLSTNRQDELLLPFKELYRASTIIVRGAINRDLAIEVQDAPRKFNSMSGSELMKSDMRNMLRLPLEESIARRRDEKLAEILATMDFNLATMSFELIQP